MPRIETINVADARKSASLLPQSDKRCDLCGSDRFQLISRLDRRGKPLDTAVCVSCGLVCHAVIPTEQQLAEYYALEYRSDYHGEIAPSARRVLRAWNNGGRILERLKPFLSRGASVFEVGAGIGCTVKRFELEGFSASGIEPGEGFQDFSRKELRTHVARGYLFNLERATHDLVLLVHVIEHFSSPSAALRHLHGLIRPGGYLYVECPNLAAPFARFSQLFHTAHIHNFTPATLSMMAARRGFEVERAFGSEDDPAIEILLRRVEHCDKSIEAESYSRTIAALNRYNALTYHLRPGYIVPRVRKVAGYVAEHLTARRALREIVQLCKSRDATASRKNALEPDRPLRRAG